MTVKKPVSDEIEALVPYPPGKPIEEVERELGIKNSIKLASGNRRGDTSHIFLDIHLKKG